MGHILCAVPQPSHNRELPESVRIREVGPRDGLQVEKPIAPGVRARLIASLAATGIRSVEAVSFVSPKAVPSMAEPEAVLDELGRIGVPDDLTVTALVPNRRGAERALETDVAELTVTISASEEYNRRNVRMSVAESLAEVAVICEMAGFAGVPVDAVVSCAFGSPYGEDIAPSAVSEIADLVRSAGVSAITLADTTGMATPSVLSGVLDVAGTDVGLHMHETRGTGLLNVYCALEAGVSRFDTSVGGLGGSPFAEGAAGNVATEGVVALLDDLRIESGIDLEMLLVVTRELEGIIGHPVSSPLARVGPAHASAAREPGSGVRPGG
jgi:hydroxymethylglutaryl-CoA lyase